MSNKKEELKKADVIAEEVVVDESVEEPIKEVEENIPQLVNITAAPEKDVVRSTGDTFKGRVVKCDKLNIRKGPSFDSEIIGTLDKGKVEQFTTTTHSAWYAFSHGFVSSNFIERI